MAPRITVDVFSGRPNPTIELEGTETDESLARLRPVRRLSEDDLGPWSGPPPAASPLGYKGCILHAPDGREWMAFGGALTLTTRESVDVRSDPERAFERQLLDSAPPNLLPPLEF